MRRTDRVPPVLADAEDGDQQPVRFGELQSLRMLEIAKDSPLETPVLADAGDGDETSNSLKETSNLLKANSQLISRGFLHFVFNFAPTPTTTS